MALNNAINMSQISTVKIQVFTPGTSTYTPSPGLVFCTVEICGSGAGAGGGAGAAGTSGMGGGGGGGGYCRKTYSAALIGANATVVVGAVANGGTAGANNGTDGNTSTFTPAGAGAILIATGGTKGFGGTATATTTLTVGGDGGTASGGDININGSFGQAGIVTSGSGGILFGGSGGGSFLSPSTLNFGGATAGLNGTAYGAGGSGGEGQNVNAAGGNSFGGVCYITEYCNQ